MTPLGLSHSELVRALARYRLRLHALMHAVESSRPDQVHNDTYQALAELAEALEVDLAVRHSDPGRERMSRVETEVLVPLLARLHRDLDPLVHDTPTRAWVATLRAADERVRAVEHSLQQP